VRVAAGPRESKPFTVQPGPVRRFDSQNVLACRDIHNFAVDREAGDHVARMFPLVAELAAARRSAVSCMGLDVVEPGLVSCTRWRPDPTEPTPDVVPQYAAIGRKP
jgi:hypothetical protein